jgi:hypothetical protein
MWASFCLPDTKDTEKDIIFSMIRVMYQLLLYILFVC